MWCCVLCVCKCCVCMCVLCCVLCVVCCVCCVWLIPDPLPTKITWATEARRCSVSSHGKCRTGIPLVCMRRRGGATMQRVDQERASRRTANCTQIFFTQRPNQAPADSRVPTSGAVLQVPQRHLSNWKRTTKMPNCRALGVRCLGVSVLVCVLVCACERVCLCCSCYRHSAASQWLTNACLPSRLPDKHQCRPPGWTPSANSPHSPPLVLGGSAGLACTTGLAARTGLPFLFAPDEVVL